MWEIEVGEDLFSCLKHQIRRTHHRKSCSFSATDVSREDEGFKRESSDRNSIDERHAI